MTSHSIIYIKAHRLLQQIHTRLPFRSLDLGAKTFWFTYYTKTLIKRLSHENYEFRVLHDKNKSLQYLIRNKSYPTKNQQFLFPQSLANHHCKLVHTFSYDKKFNTGKLINSYIIIQLKHKFGESIILKPKRNSILQNIPGILIYADHSLKIPSKYTDIDHFESETFDCFCTNKSITDNNSFLSLFKNLVSFSQNLNERLQNENNLRINRTFISFLKTHKSPMEVSIFQDKMILIFKNFQFIPTKPVLNPMGYYNQLKFLINQIRIIQ